MPSKVIKATYIFSAEFKIPKGLNIDDKSIVEQYFVRYLELFIYFKTKEDYETYKHYSVGSDYGNNDSNDSKLRIVIGQTYDVMESNDCKHPDELAFDNSYDSSDSDEELELTPKIKLVIKK